ncbi:MAG: MerR family transcriptional regulator [Bacteroidales bacterium]|nr:MerR family transcriptional regulator [Bacteroidales bacterium]
MQNKEVKIEKKYFSISEVAKMFEVNASLIRYWEKEFDIIKPFKNKKGNRLFTQDDIKNLHLIFHLVKERGMTLAGVKQKIKENKNDLDYNFEIIEKLKNIKTNLEDLRDLL